MHVRHNPPLHSRGECVVTKRSAWAIDDVMRDVPTWPNDLHSLFCTDVSTKAEIEREKVRLRDLIAANQRLEVTSLLSLDQFICLPLPFPESF